MAVSLVTFAVAVFNGKQHLPEMLSSVFRQSMRDWQLLIVDDGSSDGSAEVLQGIRDSRVKVLYHSRNYGLPDTRNELLSECETPFIAWLDQDDLAGRRRLELQVNRMTADENLTVCGSWAGRFGGGHTVFENRVMRTPTTHEHIAARALFASPIVFSSATMNVHGLRKRHIEFSSTSRNVLDYELWNRLLESSKLENIPRVLAHYRTHSGQTSKRPQEAYEMEQDALGTVGQALKRRYGYSWSKNERELHGRIMFSPSKIADLELEDVAYWLRKLCQMNAQEGFVDPHAFEIGVARSFLRIAQPYLVSRRGRVSNLISAYRAIALTKRVWSQASFSALRERV